MARHSSLKPYPAWWQTLKKWMNGNPRSSYMVDWTRERIVYQEDGAEVMYTIEAELLLGQVDRRLSRNLMWRVTSDGQHSRPSSEEAELVLRRVTQMLTQWRIVWTLE